MTESLSLNFRLFTSKLLDYFSMAESLSSSFRVSTAKLLGFQKFRYCSVLTE